MVDVVVLTGYGINCDEETKFAFETAGAKADIVHINDLIDSRKNILDYQILAFPGGFSYGDDTGSGKAFANKVRNNLWEKLLDFIDNGNLAIGICNGFQIMTNLGLLPALGKKYGEKQCALIHNDCARYLDRWVDLEFSNGSPWTKGIGRIAVPIAHGEGKFYAEPQTLKVLEEKKLIGAKYVSGEICSHFNLPANPNGSLNDIACVHDETGRIIGMMPHPERAMSFTQLPHWTFLKEKLVRNGKEIPKDAPGIKIFQNGVNYFK